MKNSALSKEAAKTIAKAKRIEDKKSAAQQAKPPEREVSLSLDLSLSHTLLTSSSVSLYLLTSLSGFTCCHISSLKYDPIKNWKR
jgi:hypothetical protein